VNRRSFLKILGAGVTIPLAAKLEAVNIPEGLTIERLKEAQKVLNDAPVDVIHMTGGFNELESYYWLRTSVHVNGREWHDLLRHTGSTLDYEAIAKLQNELMEHHGADARVTGKMVKEAFERNV